MRITAGPFVFRARLEERIAPKTCAAFLKLLPYRQKLIHARWSGEACWIPLGDFQLGVGPENAVSEPAPGQLLFYPGGISETEILFPYGRARFACKDGKLEGNPFLTVIEGMEQLPELGRLVLWKGAQDIRFELEVQLGGYTPGMQDLVWAFPVGILILLPFFFLAAFSHDRLVRRLYERHPEEWKSAGGPIGFFWRPPETLAATAPLAFIRSAITWAFRLPLPLANDPECRRTLRFLRLGLIVWNVGMLALFAFLIMKSRLLSR